VIRVTAFHGQVWFIFLQRKDRRARTAADFGDVAMSRNFGNPGFYDASVIDDRNARPLMIAFATIVMVWMLAFGLVFVSAQISAQSHHMAASAASIAK
jgi:hypothetical protein